ncbi:serine/threonine-protein kinase [Streptomyces sp. 039-1]|uniref:serine/threonine-protein kinase n=1 Tax=Streptomyces sp. 039-1 TaxID=2789263 RepID=UPI0039F47259
MGRLGSGGMGTVYLARGPGHKRLVAVKTIRADLARVPGYHQRFAREIEVARTVRSPYIAQLVAFDPGPDEPWLATELAPGPNLAEVLRNRGSLPGDTLQVLAVDLAEALSAIHGADVVHRDLKPSNVILCEDGPRLVDFGIARRPVEQGGLTTQGQFVGTSAYASPEQLLTHRTGPPSDVFSLGVVIAEAAGLPVHDRRQGPLAAEILSDGTPSLPSLPPRLRSVVHKCLSRSPDDRPTPAEIGDMLATSARSDRQGLPWLPDSVALLARRTAQDLQAVTHPATALDARSTRHHQQATTPARPQRGTTMGAPIHSAPVSNPAHRKRLVTAGLTLGAILTLVVTGVSLAQHGEAEQGAEAMPGATVTVTAPGRTDAPTPHPRSSPTPSRSRSHSAKPTQIPSAPAPRPAVFTQGRLGVSRYEDPQYRAKVTSVKAEAHQLTVALSARGPSDLRRAETTCLEVRGDEGNFTVYPFAQQTSSVRPGAFDGTLAFPLLVTGEYFLRYSCTADYSDVRLGSATVPHISISRYDSKYFSVVLSADRTPSGLQLVFASTGPPNLRDPETSCVNQGDRKRLPNSVQLERAKKELNSFFFGSMNFAPVGAGSTFRYSCKSDYTEAPLP